MRRGVVQRSSPWHPSMTVPRHDRSVFFSDPGSRQTRPGAPRLHGHHVGRILVLANVRIVFGGVPVDADWLPLLLGDPADDGPMRATACAHDPSAANCRGSTEDPLREVVEVVPPVRGVMAVSIDVPDVRHVVFFEINVQALAC